MRTRSSLIGICWGMADKPAFHKREKLTNRQPDQWIEDPSFPTKKTQKHNLPVLNLISHAREMGMDNITGILVP